MKASDVMTAGDHAAPQPERMTREQYGRLLNTLLEAERAGAKLLAAYVRELATDPEAGAWLSVIQRDEARNCSVLIHLLLEEGFHPSTAVGEFYRKGLAVQGWNARMRFLNRGQQWVADRIDSALPQISGFLGHKPLHAMYESHLTNIGICEKQLKSLPGDHDANAARPAVRRAADR